jgi:hypothetical protein
MHSSSACRTKRICCATTLTLFPLPPLNCSPSGSCTHTTRSTYEVHTKLLTRHISCTEDAALFPALPATAIWPRCCCCCCLPAAHSTPGSSRSAADCFSNLKSYLQAHTMCITVSCGPSVRVTWLADDINSWPRFLSAAAGPSCDDDDEVWCCGVVPPSSA